MVLIKSRLFHILSLISVFSLFVAAFAPISTANATTYQSVSSWSKVNIGTGWATRSLIKVINAGDLDQNGLEDIAAIDSLGRLWLYPSRTSTSFNPRKLIGTGWAHMPTVIGGIDFNMDGKDDILAVDAKGTLYLYPGKGNCKFGPRRKLGTGWSNVKHLSAVRHGYNNNPMLNGVFNGKIGTWSTDGKGRFKSKILAGSGWNSLLIVSTTGDVSGDKVPDIWAIASDGELRLYVARDRSARNFTAYRAGTGWSNAKYFVPQGHNPRVIRAVFSDGHLRHYTLNSFKPTQKTVPPLTKPYSASSLQVLVNKKNPLKPLNYAPANLVQASSYGIPSYGQTLRKDAAIALKNMYRDANAASASFTLRSGYRSYTRQKSVYNGWVSQLGKVQADRVSARPGYSEHQTGLAVDITNQSGLYTSFGQTHAGKWLAANSWKYGFILRYPQGYEHVTGFSYEPWHFRYVGVTTAKQMHAKGSPTLEHFLNKPAAPRY